MNKTILVQGYKLNVGDGGDNRLIGVFPDFPGFIARARDEEELIRKATIRLDYERAKGVIPPYVEEPVTKTKPKKVAPVAT